MTSRKKARLDVKPGLSRPVTGSFGSVAYAAQALKDGSRVPAKLSQKAPEGS